MVVYRPYEVKVSLGHSALLGIAQHLTGSSHDGTSTIYWVLVLSTAESMEKSHERNSDKLRKLILEEVPLIYDPAIRSV